ncbi:MAG TPA: RpiB/LacA/LacB family sugar-phosphate isomerase [Vicinamibacterales bacterium]|nr:RpiB/LacA/LacB family sugar-phosphate isomerase [Vicinamibacterales bacterium]
MTIPRYGLISETEARQIEAGATVELERGGHVTPLAWDTLRAKRVTVVPAGSVDPSLPADLAPAAEITRIAVGADHSGWKLKSALIDRLRKRGLAVRDCGTNSDEAVDYPDTALAVARAVVRGEADAGIVIDGSGLGSAIAANKVRGIRAAMCTTPTLARYAREHNGANVLAIGASLIDPAAAAEIVDAWLATPMREARYIRRLLKIRRIEESS